MTDATLNPVNRRDFINLSAGAVAAVGIAAATWPFINQMEPSAGVLAAGSPISVDLTPLAPGQQIVVQWRSMPIFIVRRTPEILAGLKERALLERLRDPNASEHQQPVYATNWARALNPEYLVLVGICTHLGCIPAFSPDRGTLVTNLSGGYLCHCHGSKYDLAGRVFKGVPAPLNLPVPPHNFPSSNRLVIGENPKGATFDLSEVVQL